jgi:tRNA-dihydrouridine synthase B
MLSIGKVKLENQVMLAPLAGVSDKAFRIIAKSYGCGLVFTEMISSMGLVYNQEKTLQMADTSGEERPVAVQIFGSRPDILAEAAAIVEQMGADIIDINMGCPTAKIVKNGEGAALMLDIPRARAIIREVVRAVKVPVTVKMRKGWDDNLINCLDLALAAEEEGASAIVLHPRTRMQFFSGQADWQMIKEMKRRIKIPLIGNGDIRSAADALHMLESTGCDAVMIGRAAMGNPFIFREADQLLNHGNHIPGPDFKEKLDMGISHLELACRLKGETVGVRELRKHLAWYIKGMPGATRLREVINRATNKAEIIAIIKGYRE